MALRFRKFLNSVVKHKTPIFATFCVGTASFLYMKQPISSIFDNIPSENSVSIYADKKPINPSEIPTRVDSLHRLKSGETFDVLVIGGGCTGSGIALDAANRGLNVAMVERTDYASGTSSRSTKLIHGGVRYLEKAFKNFDVKQLYLVFEALSERKHLMSIAPNLSKEVPLIVPLYYGYPEIFFYIPYFWTGMKLYDLMSGSKGKLKSSFYMGKKEVCEKFPMLNDKGLKGAIVYYDGMHNDSRMNINIALTAAHKGAAVANYVEFKEFTKDAAGKANGAILIDNVTGDEFKVKSKTIVNATGCFVDSIRHKDSKNARKIVAPSGGVHVVLSGDYSPATMGMLIPHTDDGRVLFFLPWEGSTLAGTTDASCEITERPRPTKNEVAFIMKELKKYIKTDLNVEDVNASWSGIRPLAIDLKAKNTSALSRNHEIEVSKSGVISITGGKWTTYRRMSQEVVDLLLTVNTNLKPKFSNRSTKDVPLVGASGWSLSQESELERKGFSKDVAHHLSHNYGVYAYDVAEISLKDGLDKKLVNGYPFIEAEVLFGVRHEHAVKLVDVISRRMRLSFLNSEATRECLPRVLNLMAAEKNWDTEKRIEEFVDALLFLETMNVQNKKRHSWKTKNSPEKAAENITNAFGKCPLKSDDLKNLMNSFESNEHQVPSEKLLPTLKGLSLKNSEIRKHFPKIQSYLDRSQKQSHSIEDCLFLVCGAMLTETNKD